MEYIVLALVVVGLAMVTLVLLQKSNSENQLPLAPKPLMTKRELTVLPLIEAHFPNCRVHAQVAMAALIKLKAGVDKKKRTSVRNRFDRKIIDFVVEEKQTGEIVAIVELDDKTHNATKDAARDAITAAAGYKTIRIPAGTRLTYAAVGAILRTEG